MEDIYKFIIRIVSIISFTVLAIVFKKWWLSLFVLLSTGNFGIVNNIYETNIANKKEVRKWE